MNDLFTERAAIVNRSIIEPGTEAFKAIVYGGSMAYGSVRDSSDIDLLIITEAPLIRTVASHPYFASIDEPTITAFEEARIGFFWASREIDGVMLNAFVYDQESLESFALLESELVGLRSNPPTGSRGYAFDGTLVTVATVAERYGTGWRYVRPALNEDTYYGGVPRDHFWFMYRSIIDDGWLEDLAQRSRQAVVSQLVREHGTNVDLSERNVLNTIHAYHERRDRVSEETFERIRNETCRLLGRS